LRRYSIGYFLICQVYWYKIDVYMEKIYPNKLKSGDMVRVIAPSRSLSILSEELRDIANKRFEEMGLKLSFGRHVEETDDFGSSSVEARVEDLHEAFEDKEVKGILTVIGGHNCNQMFRYIDWDIVRNNPKIFCGFSDITALNNAIFAKTGLVTYSGLHYSSFAQKLYIDYSVEYFKKCLFEEGDFELKASREWSDDMWFEDQEKRSLIENEGYLVINEGKVRGTILGANLCTFNLLQGTEYMPDLRGTVLFLEDDSESSPFTFDRDLQSIIHQSGFEGVKGIVIGRFQKSMKVTDDLLRQIIKSKKELDGLPIVAGVDFGHTDPKVTFPVGGVVEVEAGKKVGIEIVEH